MYFTAALEHLRENRQMLFLMGPRQVGKTTTCLQIGQTFDRFYYFNWDNDADRLLILGGTEKVADHAELKVLKDNSPLLIFDEIHKYKDWKNFLKGLFDSYPQKMHILVTGSARLDVYKKGGDSLMGRYFMYRFHPLTVGEILHQEPPKNEIHKHPQQIADEDFQALWEFGGYPDPYLKREKRFFNRWQNLRFQQLFQEEVRDLTRIQELGQLEILAKILRNQVGQQTSYDSLAKHVRVSGNTIRNWTSLLSSLYYCFEVRPWSKNVTRSLLKEPKYYLWDWSQIEDRGSRAENFVASHLLKAIHFWTDYGFGNYGLYYLRDKEQREVDFLVTKDDKPWFLVEVKYAYTPQMSKSLAYFQEMTKAPHAFQVCFEMSFVKKNCFESKEPVVVSARSFLSQLI